MTVFAVRGYHGSSIDEIAREAGISKALIYEHFDSKRDLHASLVAAHAGELFRRIADVAGSTDAPAEVRLRAGVDAVLGFVEERREAWRALVRDASEPELVEVLGRLQAQATAAIAQIMGASPSLHPDPGRTEVEHQRSVLMVAQMLSGAVQALAAWWHDHQDVPREVLVDQVMRFAWTGLERARGGPGGAPS